MKQFLTYFFYIFIFTYQLKFVLAAVKQISDLDSSSPNFFSYQTSLWNVSSNLTSPIYTINNNKLYIGGYKVRGIFERTFTDLAVHDIIYFSLTILVLDNWNNSADTISLLFDSSVITLNYISSYAKDTHIGGDVNYKDIGRINYVGRVIHSASTVRLRIFSNLSNPLAFQSYAIRDLNLMFGKKTASEANSYCGRSIDTSTLVLVLSDCFCPVGKFLYLVLCLSCNSACESCWGSSASQCYKCASGYYYDGKTCVSCSASCNSCSDSPTSCSSCLTGQYLTRNGSCLSSCGAPLVSFSGSNFNYCQSKCMPSEFYYWNTSCIGACNFPLSIFKFFGDNHCNYPCSGSSFLYPNGSCLSVCSGLFMQRNEGGKLFCDFKCSTTEFLFKNGTCGSTCSGPFTSLLFGPERYCNPTCEIGYYYTNGSCLSNCPSPLNIISVAASERYCKFKCDLSFMYSNGSCSPTCTGFFAPISYGIEKYCNFPCNSSQYRYSNGSCLSSCGSGFNAIIVSSIEKYCNFTCSSSFLFQNGSCSNSCSGLFAPTIQGLAKYCNFICSPLQFYLTNATCSSCHQPFIQINISSFEKYCKFPCSGSEFYYVNGSCLPTCSSPYSSRIFGLERYCDFPCKSTESMFYNGSCTPICPIGFNLITVSSVEKYCNFSCSSPNYFYYNNTCYPSCDSPFTPRVNGIEAYCEFICPPWEYLATNGSCMPTCPEGFNLFTFYSIMNYCNFSCDDSDHYYLNGTCSPTCNSSFSISAYGVEDYCLFACKPSEALLQNGSCIKACPSHFILNNVSSVEKYCNFPCNLSDYYFQNGSCISSCPNPYIPVVKGVENYCNFPCANGEYVLENRSCIADCEYPMIKRLGLNENYCDKPCEEGFLFVDNETCSPTCPFPMRPVESLYIKCESPCNESEYFYPEKTSCEAVCEYPYSKNSSGRVPLCTKTKKLIITPSIQAKADLNSGVSNTLLAGSAAGSILSSLSGGGGGSAVNIVILSEFLFNTRFMRVSFPKVLKEYYEANNENPGLVINFVKPQFEDDDIDMENIPEAFSKYEVKTSFISNFWDSLLTFLVLILCTIVLFIWEKISILRRFTERGKIFFSRLKILFRWNILIVYVCSCFSDILISAFIGFKSSKTFSSSLVAGGLIVSIIFVLLAIYIFVLTFKVSKDAMKFRFSVASEKSIKVPAIDNKHAGINFIYKDFKDEHFISVSFLFTLLLREIIFDLFLVFCEDGLVQVIMFIILSLAIITLLIVKKPYKDIFETLKFVLCELLLLVVYICILILQANEDLSEETRESLGLAIINTFLTFTIGAFGFMLLSIIVAIIEISKISLSLKKQNKLSIRGVFNEFSKTESSDRIKEFFINTVVKLRRKQRSKPKIPIVITTCKDSMSSLNSIQTPGSDLNSPINFALSPKSPSKTPKSIFSSAMSSQVTMVPSTNFNLVSGATLENMISESPTKGDNPKIEDGFELNLVNVESETVDSNYDQKNISLNFYQDISPTSPNKQPLSARFNLRILRRPEDSIQGSLNNSFEESSNNISSNKSRVIVHEKKPASSFRSRKSSLNVPKQDMPTKEPRRHSIFKTESEKEETLKKSNIFSFLDKKMQENTSYQTSADLSKDEVFVLDLSPCNDDEKINYTPKQNDET